ncbi:MAG: glycoside hydrolase family 15 protein [Candidatus Aenigmatarchaeota archaeon]
MYTKREIERGMKVLSLLQTESGLFLAAPAQETGYNKVWIRDNVYSALGMEVCSPERAVKAVRALFDILKKHEYKIDWAIREKPRYAYQYIHARYNPQTLEEYWDEWGNKQNDAVGAFLFQVAGLLKKGYGVVRDSSDIRVLKKLVLYLQSIRYWEDKDNGMWEENEELHASSIGACVAGLKAISNYIDVPKELIERGQEALDKLLPRESETKEVDMALLSLIWPYNIVTSKQRKQILKNVEGKLVRERGVIRYPGDKYYNRNGEAEWTMGFPWLAIIYKKLGNRKKYDFYMSKTRFAMNGFGHLPELYFAGSNEHNENSPLGWAQALYLVALAEGRGG